MKQRLFILQARRADRFGVSLIAFSFQNIITYPHSVSFSSAVRRVDHLNSIIDMANNRNFF